MGSTDGPLGGLSAEQVGKSEKYTGTDQCDEQAADKSGWAAEAEQMEEIATNDGADESDCNVSEASKSAAACQKPGKPARQKTDDDPPDK